MSTYKLCYFNSRGFGELARWLFTEADQEFEDFRWDHADWPKYKPDSPTGQGPWLEVDGRKIAQSGAINRFLGKRFGRYGKDEFEEARIDMVLGCCSDMQHLFRPVYFEEDPERKAAGIKKLKEEKVPEALTRLENLLVANNGGNSYFIGDDATVADYQIAISTDTLSLFDLECLLDSVPKLKALKERVLARPKIAAWIAKRPQTQF